MRTEIKKLNRLKRVLKVEVEEDVLLKDKKEIYKELSKELNVPGFRKGSAPLEVVEKHYKKFLEETFLKRIIPSYYSQALEKNELKAVGLPRIYDVDFREKGLSFYAEFEVKPHLELKDEDYKNIKVKVKKTEVEGIEIEKLITQLKDDVKKVTKKDYSDEELAKWAGYSSKEDLREAIRGEIFVNKLRIRRTDIEEIVTNELIKRINIDVPTVLLKQQEERLFNLHISDLRRRGVEERDIKKYEEDMRRKISNLAERQIKLYYIFEAIAERESLDVDENNLSNAVIGFVLSCANYVR